MIYIAVAFFLIPIILKIIQTPSISIKILFPTLIVYSFWFLLSVGLIITKMNTNYYLYFFYPFPIGLLIYESIVTYKNRKRLFFTKYLKHFSIFLFILTIVNIFTLKYGWTDTTEYIKLAIWSFQNNSFIDSDIYKYNNFYYLSMIFGNFRMNDFYYVLSIYIYGSLFFTLFTIIISRKFKESLFLPIQIVLWIFLSLFLNSKESTSVNWIGGALVSIGALVMVMLIFEDNIEWQEIFFLDVLIVFNMNFSTSGFLTSILLIIIFKVLIFIKCKNVFQFVSILWFFTYIVLIDINYSNSLKTYLYFWSIFLILITLAFLILKRNSWSYNSYFNKLVAILKVYDRSFILIKFIFIDVYLASYIITATLLLHNQVSINFSKILYFSIILFIFINLSIACKFHEIVFISMILTITSILFIIINKFQFVTTFSYITSRTAYGLVFFPLFFIPLMMIKLSYIINQKQKFLIWKKIFINLMWLPTLSPVINPTFSSFINTKLNLTFWKSNAPSKENFDFAEKHLIDLSTPMNAFSEMQLPFIRQTIESGAYLYNLYHNGYLYHENELPNFSFFHWGTNYRWDVVRTVNKMYSYVKTTTFYNSIILTKKSALNLNRNILDNYYISDENRELNLWIIK